MSVRCWTSSGGLGAEVEWLDRNVVRVQARDVSPGQLDASAAAKIRASILLAGPMVARVPGR
jgi:UDP-N-acetylglucosamine 1-carboxyvinyltransferase